jgi:hypothetical protein
MEERDHLIAPSVLEEDIQEYDIDFVKRHKDLNDRQHQMFIDKFPPFAYGHSEIENEPREFLKRFRLSKRIMPRPASEGDGRRIDAVTLESLRAYVRARSTELLRLQKSSKSGSLKFEVLGEMRDHLNRIGGTIAEAHVIDINTFRPHLVELSGAKTR